MLFVLIMFEIYSIDPEAYILERERERETERERDRERERERDGKRDKAGEVNYIPYT